MRRFKSYLLYRSIYLIENEKANDILSNAVCQHEVVTVELDECENINKN